MKIFHIKRLILVFSISLFFIGNILSQEKDDSIVNNNRIDSLSGYIPFSSTYVEINGLNKYLSFNYEQKLLQYKRYSLSARISEFAINVFNDKIYQYSGMININTQLNKLLYFQLGFGYTHYYDYIYELAETEHLYKEKIYNYLQLNVGAGFYYKKGLLIKFNFYPNITYDNSILKDYQNYYWEPKITYINNKKYSFSFGFSIGYVCSNSKINELKKIKYQNNFSKNYIGLQYGGSTFMSLYYCRTVFYKFPYSLSSTIGTGLTFNNELGLYAQVNSIIFISKSKDIEIGFNYLKSVYSNNMRYSIETGLKFYQNKTLFFKLNLSNFLSKNNSNKELELSIVPGISLGVGI